MFTTLLQLVQAAVAGVGTAQQWLGFWQPVAGSGAPLLGPVMALSSILALALLTGVAVSALATLIIALLAIYLLFTEVLGLSIEVTP